MKARQLAAAAGDRQLQAAIDTNISWLYSMMGDLPDAIQAIESALQALPKDQPSPYLARILAQRATLYSSSGRLARAAELFAAAYREADRRQDDGARIQLLDAYGRDLLEFGDLKRAEAVLTEAYRLRLACRRPVNDICYRNLAMLRLAQGDLDGARVLINRAFEAARASRQASPPWSLYYERARVENACGHREQALADLGAALENIHDLRLDLLPADAVRTRAGVWLQRVYDEFIKTAVALYREQARPELARLAFQAAEQNRARSLRESLEESERLRNRLPGRYWELVDRLSQAENTLFRARDAEAIALVGRLRHQLNELEVEAGLRVAGGESNLEPCSPGSLQRTLPASEALLAFYLSEPRSYIWALTGKHFELRTLPGRGELEGRVRRFRAAVAAGSPEAARLGARLYQTLFGTLSPEIRSQPHWSLVLDGCLFEVPFPALVVETGEAGPTFLVERYALGILPGASFAMAPETEDWWGPLVAVGDPISNTADPRLASARRSRSSSVLAGADGVECGGRRGRSACAAARPPGWQRQRGAPLRGRVPEPGPRGPFPSRSGGHARAAAPGPCP